jgi:hypothetical protein
VGVCARCHNTGTLCPHCFTQHTNGAFPGHTAVSGAVDSENGRSELLVRLFDLELSLCPHRVTPTSVCATCVDPSPVCEALDCVSLHPGHTLIPLEVAADAMRAYLLSTCATVPAWAVHLPAVDLAAMCPPSPAGVRAVPRAVSEVRRLIQAMNHELGVIPGNAEAARLLAHADLEVALSAAGDDEAAASAALSRRDTALAAIDADEAIKIQSVEADIVAADGGLEKMMMEFDLFCDAADRLLDIEIVSHFPSLRSRIANVLLGLRELALNAGDAGAIIGGNRGAAAVACLSEASHFALIGLVSKQHTGVPDTTSYDPLWSLSCARCRGR